MKQKTNKIMENQIESAGMEKAISYKWKQEKQG